MPNYNAARALADAMGAPQPTPAGRDMAQQIAVAFNAYAGRGTGVVDVTRPDDVPPGVNLGVKADFWKDPTFQKGALVAGAALLILWWQARNDPRR